LSWRIAISTIAENCRSFLSLKPTLPGIDAVLVERFGAGRMIGEKPVADVVEITHDRHSDAHLAQAVFDMRNCGGGLVAIDRDADDLRPGTGQRRDLARGALDVGSVGIGHRLYDDRRAAADAHPADIHRHGFVAPPRGSKI
jgi:hypothetical protein